MNDEPAGWQPPQFKEYRSDPVEFCINHLTDADMVRFAKALNEILTRSLSEGATSFEVQWRNVLSRDKNPDGKVGTIRIISTR